MEDWQKRIATGAISLLIGTIALDLFPEIQTSSDVINALNNPLAQLFLLVIIIYVFISGSVNWLRNLLSKRGGIREPYTPYTGSKPQMRTLVGEIRYAGVKWPFLWGDTNGRSHGWVDRPTCPSCGTELNSDTVRRRVRSDKNIWECPACDFSTTRGGITEQRESVQKIIEQEADKVIQSLMAVEKDEIKSMLNEIEEVAGVDLNFRQSNYRMSDPERQSIDDAIEEIIDKNDLQNREKVLVLDHLLGCEYGPQDQYDILWFETYDPSARKMINRWR